MTLNVSGSQIRESVYTDDDKAISLKPTISLRNLQHDVTLCKIVTCNAPSVRFLQLCPCGVEGVCGVPASDSDVMPAMKE